MLVVANFKRDRHIQGVDDSSWGNVLTHYEPPVADGPAPSEQDHEGGVP